jgi:3-deoxy-D-arabino-heptulosonate 7-phosphate (DAHP) synthase class II
LEGVLNTLESFPPLVCAGEARSLEARLGDTACGRAFLLQGGDCAESFKKFNANSIRDTFRILLQMGVVLMFGGQLLVMKVCLLPGFSGTHFVADTCFLFSRYIHSRTCMQCTSLRSAPPMLSMWP